MMTIKQARVFKERCERGERPPLPGDQGWLLNFNADEIAYEIRHERTWDYGTRAKTAARRLRQMGLLDGTYNRTDLGREYFQRYYYSPPEREKPSEKLI